MNPCNQNHATFIQRLLAFLVDLTLIMIVGGFFAYLRHFSKEIAVFSIIISPTLMYAYYIITQKKYGKTLGKYFLKISLITTHKDNVSYKNLFMRYSVEIFFATILNCLIIIALYLTPAETYSNLSWVKQMVAISANSKYFHPVNYLSQFYMAINILWLIFHKQNRALHDIIGGTIVVSDRGVMKNSINEINCNLDKIITNLEQ